MNIMTEFQDDLKPSAPFKRMKYLKADRLFGTDKPDLRIPWSIEDCTSELSFLRKREISNFVVKIFIARNAEDVVNERNLSEWTRILQNNVLSQVCNVDFFVFQRNASFAFSQVDHLVYACFISFHNL